MSDGDFTGCRMSNSPDKGPIELLKLLYQYVAEDE